ncbi:MAG: N-acetyltransferase [Planctomycetota bacterium]|nr:N-acetyltransferase [Planctomycetota bacterium]
MQIRFEVEKDGVAVHALNTASFDTRAEADLVDALRVQAQPFVSLVAEDEGLVVGHIMFTPVSLSGHPQLKIMGIGPMAVESSRQRKGIGSGLVRAGLEECRKLGFGAVVVLGHAEYYPRFGFVKSTEYGIDSEYKVRPEYFMALELQDGYLRGVSGTIKYNAVFGNV